MGIRYPYGYNRWIIDYKSSYTLICFFCKGKQVLCNFSPFTIKVNAFEEHPTGNNVLFSMVSRVVDNMLMSTIRAISMISMSIQPTENTGIGTTIPIILQMVAIKPPLIPIAMVRAGRKPMIAV